MPKQPKFRYFMQKQGRAMKSGFSLLIAIFFMIGVMGIAMLSLKFSATSLNSVTQSYINEQAEILAQSATEYAMLRLLKHDFNQGCLTDISTTFTPSNTTLKLYDIKISIELFGNIGNCKGIKISEPSQNGSVIIDVGVTYNKSEDDAQIYPVRFFKRTLQKL